MCLPIFKLDLEGEMSDPHAIAIDSEGRIFVADRRNARIQIFDQKGVFLDHWNQFGPPSDIYIDADDVIYVTDTRSLFRSTCLATFTAVRCQAKRCCAILGKRLVDSVAQPCRNRHLIISPRPARPSLEVGQR